MTDVSDTHTEPPRYRLLRPTTDHMGGLIGAGAVIQFDGVPNAFMVPLNAAARAAMEFHRIEPAINPAPERAP